MHGPLKTYFLDTLASRDFAECDLVNAPRARGLVAEVMNDPHADFKSGERAWWAIVPYLWSKALLGGAGQSVVPPVASTRAVAA
jgi:hypothetical protein